MYRPGVQNGHEVSMLCGRDRLLSVLPPEIELDIFLLVE